MKDYFTEELEFKYAEMPASIGLYGKIPNEEYYFYILKNMEFQPVLKGDPEQMRDWYLEY